MTELASTTAPSGWRRHPHRSVGTLVAALVVSACSPTGPVAGLPAAPSGLVATPAHTSVSVHFVPGDDGGHPLRNHHYSLDDGATWTPFEPHVTTGPATIAGLTNGDTYDLRLRAVNDRGAGPPSDALAITPIARSYALRMGGTSSDGLHGVAALDTGGVVVVGTYVPPATIGGVVDLPAIENHRHAIVVRLDAGGRVTWQSYLVASGAGSVDLYGVARLADGSLAVAGSFRGTLAVPGVTTLESSITVPFFATLDEDGTWLAAGQASGASTTPRGDAFAIAADPNGGAVIVGEFRGRLAFGGVTIESPGSTSGFVAAFDANGSWTWALAAGSTAIDNLVDVAVSADGTTFVAGVSDGDAEFFPVGTLGAVGFATGFVASVSPSGAWRWATYATGSTSGSANSLMAVGADDVLVAGAYMGQGWFGEATAVTSTGSNADAFVGRLGGDGVWAWVTTIDSEGHAFPFGLDGLGDGRAIVAGGFSETASFEGAGFVTSEGSSDSFVALLDDDGAWVWVERFGSEAGAWVARVAALADGGATLVGSFRSTLQLPFADLVSAGETDGFVVKVGPDGAW